MKRPRVVRITQDVIGEVLDGEAVLLHVKTGRYFSLNSSGTRIWQLIQEHGSVEQVTSAFWSALDVDARTAEEHVSARVARLEGKGLLTVEHPEQTGE